MIPENIKEMLKSGDIEMAQLGCTLIPQYAPKGIWERILEQYLHPDYKWDIIKKIIYLKHRWINTTGQSNPVGLYSQLTSGYVYNYNIKTFSGKVLTDAIGQFLTTKLPPIRGKFKKRKYENRTGKVKTVSKQTNSRARIIETASSRARAKSKILEGAVRSHGLLSEKRSIRTRIRKVPGNS